MSETESFMKVDPSHLQLKEWQQISPGLKVGFTTRTGGVSTEPFHTFNLGLHVQDVEQHTLINRNILATKLGMPLSHWVSGEQIHDTYIKVVKNKDKGRGSRYFTDSVPNTDGLITNQSHILCTAFFAD